MVLAKVPTHLVLGDPGELWAHGPGIAVVRREAFLLLLLVGPLNFNSRGLEVPELNFLTPD